ncbi:MFS transporter [Mesorhizobium sp. WSM4935]|uniref:MFS transporter n=1 Tax=Mesorhizobium sp. WSM4935 TaxID=3038547 RepID=UPI003014EEF5
MDTAPEGSGTMARLLPIMASVFAGFLLIGLALRVLPLHLHKGLGFGPFAVGLVTGSQFVASLLSRIGAGNYADARGGKRAVVIGLVAAALAGFIYLGSLALLDRPTASASMLFVGRAVLGAAESFIITGGVAWGLALAGGQHSGKVIAWVGTAAICFPCRRRGGASGLGHRAPACLQAILGQKDLNGKCATRDGSWESSGRLPGPPQCGGTSVHSSLAKPRLSRAHELPVTTALPLAHL